MTTNDKLGAPPENAPLVSIIIPAYNSGRHISDAINSAIQQDYPSFEIIVIDDGSTDDTRTIVSRHGDRVRLLTQPNQGSAAARNRGVQHANGRYIAFLDADDVWRRDKLRYQVDALKSGGYKMAYSRFIWWQADEHGLNSSPEAEFEQADNPNVSRAKVVTGQIYAELLLDCIVWTSTVIVEKTELEKAGLFDEGLRKGQDYDLWIRLSRQIDILGLELPTALYRIHPEHITSRLKEINYEYVILSRALERWGESGPDGRRPPAGLVSARLARSSFGHGYAHFKGGNPRIASRSFWLSMKHSGPKVKTLAYWLASILQLIVGGAPIRGRRIS